MSRFKVPFVLNMVGMCFCKATVAFVDFSHPFLLHLLHPGQDQEGAESVSVMSQTNKRGFRGSKQKDRKFVPEAAAS